METTIGDYTDYYRDPFPTKYQGDGIVTGNRAS